VENSEMKKIISAFLLYGLILSITLKANLEQGFCGKYIPVNVRLGMDIQEFKKNKTTAFMSSLDFKANKVIDHSTKNILLETILLGNQRQSYWYYFIDNKLVGILRGSLVETMSPESAEVEAAKMYKDLKENCTKLSEYQIQRLSNGHQNVVTAELWEINNSSLNVYFISTTQETSIYIFDSKSLDNESFFTAPNNSRSQQEYLAQIRKKSRQPTELQQNIFERSRESLNRRIALLSNITETQVLSSSPNLAQSRQIEAPTKPNAEYLPSKPSPSVTVWPWTVGLLLLAVFGGVWWKFLRK
jgi:hypothetical protein